MERLKLPDGRDYQELIVKNNHFALYRNNILEYQHKMFNGEAYGKYYEIYKYINYDEFFGGRTSRHLTFIKAYKTKGMALRMFNKFSEKYN